MKWLIPGKTFLLGEYAALAEESAIVITTNPCFQLDLTPKQGLQGIHPDSPAGQWWQRNNLTQGLVWHDPYQGRGGLGASSAQFLGSYLASCYLQAKSPNLEEMLNAYYLVAWSGKGLRPSGYDVIAQSHQGCIYINRKNKALCAFPWVFKDLSFFLIHTEKKLATHHHLQETTLPAHVEQLSLLVDEAKQAFEEKNSEQLIACIKRYHEKLLQLNLVAPHSLQLINELQQCPEVLAIKGCGALGADILLIVTWQKNALLFKNKLKEQNHIILATDNSLCVNESQILAFN